MTDENEVKDLERSLLATILRGLLAFLLNRKTQMALMGIAGSIGVWLTARCESQPTALDTQYSAATCAAFMRGRTQMNLKQVLTCAHLICATYPAACQPTPVPVPPAPSAAGGAAGTGGTSSTGGNVATGGMVATGGESAVVQFPACSASMRTPSPAELQQYRRTLRPRHKSRPRAQRAPVSTVDAALVNVFWRSNTAEPLDQGSLGSCTGNASAQCVSTHPFANRLTEADAVSIYSLATQVDSYPGSYPPTDTGSDGASACKALVQLGYAKSCTNFSGYSDALSRVQTQPIIVGINWYSSMFTPNSCGGLSVSGTVEGGHEVEIIGYDAGNKRVWLQNSWGNSWGVCLDTHCGYFYLGVNDIAGSKLDAEFDAPDAS